MQRSNAKSIEPLIGGLIPNSAISISTFVAIEPLIGGLILNF